MAKFPQQVQSFSRKKEIHFANFFAFFNLSKLFLQVVSFHMLQKLKVVGYSSEFTFWNLKKVLDDLYLLHHRYKIGIHKKGGLESWTSSIPSWDYWKSNNTWMACNFEAKSSDINLVDSSKFWQISHNSENLARDYNSEMRNQSDSRGILQSSILQVENC